MKAFEIDVSDELRKARSKFNPLNSAHEGYAVLLEEVDEVWDEVKKNDSRRDYAAMYRELVQVSAMAQRMAEEIVLRQIELRHIERKCEIHLTTSKRYDTFKPCAMRQGVKP